MAAPTEESVPIEEKPAEPEGASAEDTNQVEPQDEAKAVENGEAVDEVMINCWIFNVNLFMCLLGERF